MYRTRHGRAGPLGYFLKLETPSDARDAKIWRCVSIIVRASRCLFRPTQAEMRCMAKPPRAAAMRKSDFAQTLGW